MRHLLVEEDVDFPASELPVRLARYFVECGARDGTVWLELTVPFEDLGLPRIGQFSRGVLFWYGPAVRRSYATMIPISWHVADSRVFPRFEGWIEIEPRSPMCSSMTILGQYQPPLGPLGTVLDAIAGRRVAELTVRHFLGELKAAVGRVALSAPDPRSRVS